MATWEAYRDVTRLGRKTRLPEQQRAVLWSIFDRIRSGLNTEGLLATSGMFSRLAALMACDDQVIPLQERIESVSDDRDLKRVYDTERHRLYVACTRARDHLLITAVDPASEFLDDLRMW